MTHVLSSPVRVLIADDYAGVRRELATLLTLAGGIEVVGEAPDGAEAVRQVRALRPAVVLMDLEMPVMDGFQAAAAIKAVLPATRVLAFTVYSGEAERVRATAAGCDGFLVKGAPLESVIAAICNPINSHNKGGPK